MPPRYRPRLRQRTPIQSGGGAGEFGGRLYTGRNPFTTPNDPGMDFGARPRWGGGPTMPSTTRPGPPNIGRDRMGMGIMGLPGGEASDTYNALVGGLNRDRNIGQQSTGLYQTWKDIKRRLGESTANQWLKEQQMAYRPGTHGSDYDDDDYGPFIPESVLEMDEFGGQYDPDVDEYIFDYIRGNLANTGLT